MENHVYNLKDYERLRLRTLDILEEKANSIIERLDVYVSIEPRNNEHIHAYKNRLKRLLENNLNKNA